MTTGSVRSPWDPKPSAWGFFFHAGVEQGVTQTQEQVATLALKVQQRLLMTSWGLCLKAGCSHAPVEVQC